MILNQAGAIRQWLCKYGVKKSNTILKPMDKNSSALLRKESETIYNIPYREAIGSLLYQATCARPYIWFAVQKLAQFCQSPTRTQWYIIKRVFRYLKVSAQMGIAFGRFGIKYDFDTLVGYSDSDWKVLPCRELTSGPVMFQIDFLISWKRRKKYLVSLCTTDVEIIALWKPIRTMRVFTSFWRSLSWSGKAGRHTSTIRHA